ncbi:unnamed protein product [Adineta steineri]|uniref:Ubiquitin carboxyl-terminal hydrolase n=1 Tax=Adineta steineri TaxID=433720 RepID=A0A813NGG4_9BILA|nr:unnamed protein product [Adineta steineri]CAF4077833.1 unnamed protein product [Adineta steineri]
MSDYSEQRDSLSVVPKLHSAQKYIVFRVCQTYRNRGNMRHISISDDKTLEQLKEEICIQLQLTMEAADFSLTRFDDKDDVWVPINNIDMHHRISNLHLPSYSIMNIEQREETNTDDQHISKSRTNNLTLKLCKQPMDKSKYIFLTTDSMMTIDQLKENARKEVMTTKTNYLYLWKDDNWIKFDTQLDDLTLNDLGFEQYSIISFETEYDPIPGVCGLTNLGNTCFMNSALQCLSNIPEFTRKVLSFGNEMNAPIIGAYTALIKTMWSGDYVVTTPSTLLLNIRDSLPRFPRYKQQDAQEFMNYFLHLIHQEFTDESTLITNLFYGGIQSSVKCLDDCCHTETNEEKISFLPLPIENESNQYNILYLRSNGEQRFISIRTGATALDRLVSLFIEQYEPNLSLQRIRVVRIVNNKMRETLPLDMSLNDINKDQLTFIELPEKTVDQRFIQFLFLDRETGEPFRPPVFIVGPQWECRYRDLSQQINQIQNHFCSITDASINLVKHLYWINEYNEIRPLKPEKDTNDTLLFMDYITMEIDYQWIQKYKHLYNFDRSTDKSSLDSLLVDFFQEEPLNGDYYCSQCHGLRKATQKADLALPLPRILIIQLKRFTYDAYSDRKIDTYIDFPLTNLDLSRYIIQNSETKTDIVALYDLVAVSNHTGNLIGGHYITYAKNDRNKTWYSFNDDRICEVTNEKDIVTKNAYILIYVKQM